MPAALLLLTALSAPVRPAPQDSAPPVVLYEVSLERPSTQMVEVTMHVPCAGQDSVEVLLPVWRPGRYTILDPVSTLRSLTAESDTGASLEVEPIAKSAWRIATGGAASIAVRYAIYANSIGDRTRHVDDTHAFLSGASIFMYSPPLRDAPAHVVIDAPESWTVATGLETEANGVLHADDYDVLVDSPIEVGLHDRFEFDVQGVPHELVIWPPGIEIDRERLIGDLTKIVTAQTEIFGRMPYERYVFLVHAGAGGGGTEHLNSTIMQTSRSALEGSGGSYRGFLSLSSHEFFHTWNVKQLRPAGMHPYDYQGENYTDLLWFAEGGTSYFGGLTLVRAGLNEPDSYLQSLLSSIRSMRERPGARVQSAAASSFNAWTKGSRNSQDDYNTEVSFYSKGLVVFLLLDMEVRARTQNRLGLDDVLRTMFERFPLSGPGYTSSDFVTVLDELTRTSFSELFAAYVDGTEQLPFEQALLTVGLELRFDQARDSRGGEQTEGAAQDEPASPKLKADLGMRLRDGGSGARVSSLRPGGAAELAGLMPGDELIALDGKRLRSSTLAESLAEREPGEVVRLHYLRRDELRELAIALDGVPDGRWRLERVDEPTDLQKATYAAWLGQPWPGTGEEASGDDAPAGDEPSEKSARPVPTSR